MPENPAEKIELVGLGLTEQRRLVIKALYQLEHATAQAVFDCIQLALDPDAICLATVYNNLNLLYREGVIGKITGIKGAVIFDKDPDSHQHFLHPDGTLSDISPDQLVTFAQVPDIPEGVDLSAVEVLVHLKPKA